MKNNNSQVNVFKHFNSALVTRTPNLQSNRPNHLPNVSNDFIEFDARAILCRVWTINGYKVKDCLMSYPNVIWLEKNTFI